jgi:hypothetical protein
VGRRSRKRTVRRADARPPAARPPAERPADARAPAPGVRAPGQPVSRRARMDEAPPAPWAPVPLVELCVLAGLVLIVAGVLSDGSRSRLLLGCGIALAALAGLELSVREHFSGFRSHSTLLAAVVAILAATALLVLTALPQLLLLGIAIAVFGAVFVALRSAFRARAGGLGFRA